MIDNTKTGLYLSSLFKKDQKLIYNETKCLIQISALDHKELLPSLYSFHVWSEGAVFTEFGSLINTCLHAETVQGKCRECRGAYGGVLRTGGMPG